MKKLMEKIPQNQRQYVYMYGNLTVLLILLSIWLYFWSRYDYIIIPQYNDQMYPSFQIANSHAGRRFPNINNINLQHGDVVYYSFSHSKASVRRECLFFARVIGLPGDMIAFKKGKVHRNGQLVDEPYVAQENQSKEDTPPILIPAGHVYLLIDNRVRRKGDIYFRDSRHWGPILIESLEGFLNQ